MAVNTQKSSDTLENTPSPEKEQIPLQSIAESFSKAGSTTYLSSFDGKAHKNQWYDTNQVETLTGQQVAVSFSDLTQGLRQGELEPRVYLAKPGEVSGSTVSTNHFRTVAPIEQEKTIDVILMDSYGEAFSIAEQEGIKNSLKQNGKDVRLFYIDSEGNAQNIETAGPNYRKGKIAVTQESEDLNNCGPLASLACNSFRDTFVKMKETGQSLEEQHFSFKIGGEAIDLSHGASHDQVNSLRNTQLDYIRHAPEEATRVKEEWQSEEVNAKGLLDLIIQYLKEEISLIDLIKELATAPKEVAASAIRSLNNEHERMLSSRLETAEMDGTLKQALEETTQEKEANVVRVSKEVPSKRNVHGQEPSATEIANSLQQASSEAERVSDVEQALPEKEGKSR